MKSRMSVLPILALLATMSPGQVGPRSRPTATSAASTLAKARAIMRKNGRPTVDIRQLGALPGGGTNATATRKAIQAALDALTQKDLPPGRPTLIIPPGNWLVDRWVSPPAGTAGVLISGDGGQSSLAPWGNGFSPLLLGLPFRPRPNMRAMDPAQFFPLDKLLDGTVKNRFGYRTCSPGAPFNGFATAWDTPLDLGPTQGWGTLMCLTVEFCIDSDQTPIGRAHVAGMSKGSVAGPWIVIGAPGRVDLLYTLGDEAKSRRLSIPYTDKRGRRRLAYQVNLSAGTVAAWLDGIRVATSGDPAPPSGSKLADNLDLPFHLGASGASGVARSDYFQGNPTTDLAVCGLRISTVPRYVDSTPSGKPIARIDGAKVTDANSYYAIDSGTIGALDVTGDPADLASCRFVPFSGVAASTFAAFAMDPDHANNFSSIGPVRIEGLSLRTAGCGAALTIGATMDATIVGCVFDGMRGIGSPSGLVNYTTRLRDSTVSGAVGGIRLFNATAVLDAINFGVCGRDGALAAWSSNSTIRDSWVAARYTAGCVPRTYFRSLGGALIASNIGIDNEESASPTTATYAATATFGDGTAQPAYLKLDRCGSNTHKGIPLVRLDRDSFRARVGTARIIDPMMTTADAVVLTDSRSWNVILDDPTPRAFPKVFDLSSPGPPGPTQPVGSVRIVGPDMAR